jgi:hypothetical protein
MWLSLVSVGDSVKVDFDQQDKMVFEGKRGEEKVG